MTSRTWFQYHDSSLCLRLVLWCLLCLDIEAALLASSLLLFHILEAALLASSLLWSLQLFHVVEAVPRRILLHLNFGVDALLVLTLLN